MSQVTLYTQAGADAQFAKAGAGMLEGTPTNPTVRPATTGQTGVVELATNTEATAGTDTTRAMTPAASRAAGDARYIRTINGTSPDSNGNVDAGGAGGGWELIASTPVVGTGTATFASIPQTYDKLRLEWVMHTTQWGGRNCTLTCNGDSGANYATNGNARGATGIPILAPQGRAQGFVECFTYRTPNNGGHIFAGHVVGNTNAGNNNLALSLLGGVYLTNAAITSLSMTMTAEESGTFYLYGAKR